MIHVLSPDELDPPLGGDLRLIDVETNAIQDVSIDNRMRRLYSNRLESWKNELQAFCSLRGMRYLSLSTAVPWDKFILHELRAAGVVK